MIKIGDAIPDVTVKHLGANGLEDVTTGELFAGGKVALFGLPGAYTPTCSAKHLPGFVAQYDALKAKGVDKIVCLSVNDAFVMKAWAESQAAEGKVETLADGLAAFTKALGLEADLSVAGLGVRCRRFALIADKGVVTWIAVEEAPGAFEVSSAEAVLAQL